MAATLILLKKLKDLVLNPILNSRPNNVEQFMKERGDVKIVIMEVCREPIQAQIKEVLNVLLKGELKKKQKNLSYDDVYHLFVIFTLENGERYSIEKNETIVIKRNPQRGGECKTIDLRTKGLMPTFNKIIPKLENRLGEQTYRYDPTIFNCQNFVLNFVQVAGISGLEDFIYQDFKDIFTKTTKKFATGVVDIASIITRLFNDSVDTSKQDELPPPPPILPPEEDRTNTLQPSSTEQLREFKRFMGVS